MNQRSQFERCLPGQDKVAPPDNTPALRTQRDIDGADSCIFITIIFIFIGHILDVKG
jgi:hypothetical protein